MIQRIEFIGPMGAGKSTIYTLLKKMLGGVFSPKILRTDCQEKKRILLAEAKQVSLMHWAILNFLSKVATIEANLITNKITSSGWQALSASCNSFSPLLDHALHGRPPGGVDLCYVLKRMSLLIREVTDVALIEEFAQADLILHDQSVLQRGVALGFGYERGDLFTEKYFHLAPAPSAVIYISGNEDFLVSRLVKRDGLKSRHLRYVQESIMYSRIGSEVLRERGVPVIEVNGDGNLENKVDYCITELKKMLLRQN